MNVHSALGIRHNEIVAFVGGGGKTTAIYIIARELQQAGRRVLIATTTKMYPPEQHQADVLLLGHDRDQSIRRITEVFDAGESIVVFAPGMIQVKGETKLDSIDPAWAPGLLEAGADVALIEADGSARRPIKAPGEHEPVYPISVGRVVAVVGLDAIGAPFGPDTAFRHDRVASITGLRVGDPITVDAIVALLVHPEGILGGAPAIPHVVLLNKADDDDRLALARRVADRLLPGGNVERVAIAALESPDPIKDVVTR